MYNEIVLEHIGNPDIYGWSWDVHDVDMYVLLALTLCILHDNLVDPRLFPLRIDDVQLNTVTMDSEVDVFADLQKFAVFFDKDLEIRLLLAFNLVQEKIDKVDSSRRWCHISVIIGQIASITIWFLLVG